MSLPRIVVAVGHSGWLAAARARMRAVAPTADVLVLQYEGDRGRVGFDCDASAQSIFRWIIGSGVSWNAQEGNVTEYISGSPTDYVVELFKAGFAVPTTVVPSSATLSVDIAKRLQGLTEAKPEDSEHFGAEIGAVALACERVCVHSITQWETIVLTPDPCTFIEGLKAVSANENAHFDFVADETEIPQW